MIKTEGIVLNEIRYKETSKILNIYTKELGKVTVMAQGAFRPKSSLMASTQSFTLSEFYLKKGRNFYYINNSDVLDSYYSIRENMERMIYGFYILELIEKSTPFEEENERIFLLLKKGLKILSELDRDFLKFVAAYEVKFISFLGYRPYLNRCVNCNKEIKSDMKFSSINGGLLCEECYSIDLSAKSVDSLFVKGLNDLLYSSLDSLDDVNIFNTTLKSIHDVLLNYILLNIERKEFKSLNILNSIGEF
ncbi:DNA repair protein RecO [Paratissierella segnis]|uniref:DNA repair protein RecO n=1 Tax=Paratissierella segnis TaxID=2763679 RepID=A0A926EY52_9FIRM|nr:DNA repair protein RecO [Paratissierella segnis]MBC8588370.1 DNA repair protein RecO [Paratissierella segnis]